ncbi:MAG: acyl-CoA synthetase [Gaiellaceae bacterium]
MINRVISDRARNTPNRVAVDDGARRWTYAELDARSEELAACLEHGERVATLTANTAEHVAVFFACAKAGAILLPLSWRLSPHELAYQLDDAEPALLLAADEFAGLADETLAIASMQPARTPVPRDESSQGKVEPGDPLLLVYTSGTTGKPKGALLTHANCFWTNLSFDLATSMHGDDVVLQVLPQFHVGGWNVQPLLAWWKGATVVLERDFDPGRALRLIEEKRVTTMMGVPATYLFMANEPTFERADLSSLRCCVVGGAPMPEALLETWQRRGVDIVQGYGLTEASPNVLCLAPEDAVRKTGWAGKPYPHVDVSLSDEDELLVEGPNVFPGYWRNEAATRDAFTADGRLRTGDIAERDDEGNYRIKGRLKDMVISGGENVYPAEVEAVLHEHPAVVEAAIVGRPDAKWGEVCVAFVVLRAEATEQELIEHCRAKLARFKVPKEVRFVESLPRSGMNKVLKDELRAVLA